MKEPAKSDNTNAEDLLTQLSEQWDSASISGYKEPSLSSDVDVDDDTPIPRSTVFTVDC